MRIHVAAGRDIDDQIAPSEPRMGGPRPFLARSTLSGNDRKTFLSTVRQIGSEKNRGSMTTTGGEAGHCLR